MNYESARGILPMENNGKTQRADSQFIGSFCVYIAYTPNLLLSIFYAANWEKKIKII